MLSRAPKASFLTSPFPYHLLFGALLFVLLALKWSLLQDCDTFYHVRAGQYMLQTHTFIREDIFSFYTPVIPWNNYAWLSQIIMALLYQFAGLKGISLFYFALIAVIYSILFRQMEIRSNTKIAVVMSFFVIFNSAFHWHARPHIFTMLFLLIWQQVLSDFQRNGNRKQLFILPLSVLLWINLHGGVLSGFFLLGIYFGGNLLQALTSKEAGEKTKTYAGVLALCLAASLGHPDGLHWWHSVFNLTSSKLIADNIIEFLPLNLHQFTPFLNFFFISILILALSRSSVTLIEWLIYLVFAPMALYSIRHIPLFVFLTAPILAGHAAEIFGRLFLNLKMRSQHNFSTALMPIMNLLFIGVIIAGTFYALSPAKKYEFDSEMLPRKAVDFAINENLPGRLFASDEVGDYMLYRKPQDQVFIYGYNDLDGIDRFSDFLKVNRGRKGWEKILEKHEINWILADTQGPLTLILERHPDWKSLYSDELGTVFIRNAPANQAWIDKFPNTTLAIKSSLT